MSVNAIQQYSFRTAAACGFVQNTHGTLSIIPKPSAMIIYSPVTKYLSHWPGRAIYEKKKEGDATKYDNTDWDLTGVPLLRDQAGYECLLICNAMNGFYLQIGVWERDPQTRYIADGYRPPTYDTPPRPWARSLKSNYLTPIEVCCTGGSLQKTYAGRSRKTEQDEWESQTADKLTLQARVDELERPMNEMVHTMDYDYYMRKGFKNSDTGPSLELFVYKEDKMVDNMHTPTYAKNICVQLSSPSKKPTVLCIDCPAPYNIIDRTDIPQNTWDKLIYRYMCSTANDQFAYLQETTTTSEIPFVEGHKGEIYPIFDTELELAEKSRTNLNCARPILWDKPLVFLNPAHEMKNTADEPTRKSLRVVVVPLMLYHYPLVTGNTEVRGPIDGRTGRRWCRGKTYIGFLTTDDAVGYFGNNVSVRPYMIQVSRPITKNPIYTEKSLAAVLKQRERERMENGA